MNRVICLALLLAFLASCDGPVEPADSKPPESEPEQENQNRAPTVAFLGPDSGMITYPGARVVFEVEATDPEEGNLTGGSIHWFNAAGDTIGTGTSFEGVAPDSDSLPRTWEISVEAADSVGLVDRASISLDVNPRVLWTLDLGVNFNPANMLALAPGGPLYVGGIGNSSAGSLLAAVTLDGAVSWWAQGIGSSLWTHSSGMVVGPDGTLYVVDFDGIAYAYDKNSGALLWQQKVIGVDSHGRLALSEGGALYVNGEVGPNDGSRPTALKRIDTTDGGVLWEVEGARADIADVWIGPSDNPGTIFDEFLTRVSPAGVVLSDVLVPATRMRASAVDNQGNIYYSGSGEDFFVLDPSGNIRWSEIDYEGNMVIDGAGTVYVVDRDLLGRRNILVTAFSSNGDRLWRKRTPPQQNGAYTILWGHATLVEGGILYVSSGSTLLALSRSDGSTLWTVSLDSGIDSPLVVATDGTVYFVTAAGFLTAVHGEGALDPSAPWPTFRADNQRTARAAG